MLNMVTGHWSERYGIAYDNLGFRPVDVKPKGASSSSITDSARTSTSI